MKEILDARAEELASRGTGEQNGSLQPMLISEWPGEKWAFPITLFRTVLDTDVTPCPAGVTFRGLPCSGFLYFQSKVFPVVEWSHLAGLPAAEEVVFAVSLGLELALGISANCRVEKLDFKNVERDEGRFCQGRLGDHRLARLEVDR